MDQGRNGDRWVHLGAYEMPAGDEWNVLVSRWSADEGFVVADTIRVIDVRREYGPDPG